MKNTALRQSFAAMAALALVVAGCGSAWADIPASAYVQDGLVALYDGIENAGEGRHEEAPAVWKNLAKGADDATLPEGQTTVGVNYIKLSAAALIPSVSCYKDTQITLETHVRAVSFSGTSGCALLLIDNRAGIYYDKRTDRYFQLMSAKNTSYDDASKYNTWYDWIVDSRYNDLKFASTARTVSGYVPAGGHDAKTPRMTMDGVMQNEPTWSWSWAPTTTTLPTGTGSIGASTAVYEMYCARIYNCKLTPEQISHNARIDSLRFSADADGYFYEDGEVKALQKLSVSRHGCLRIGSDDLVSNVTFKVGNASVTVKPIPDDGYEFVAWQGDLGGKTPAADGSLVLDNTKPLELVATFRAVGAATRTWSGTVSSDWNDAANWSGAVPAVNDFVVIPAGKTAVLATTTPVFEDVEVSGVVVMSNATACLRGVGVTVKTGGMLTCAAAALVREEVSRVSVVCEDFTLASGGSVNVSGMGYKAGATVVGAGANGYGGAHGGCGGSANWGNRLPYDSAENPTEPGAPGASKNGGGIVRIEATGKVVLDGTVEANGENATYYKSYQLTTSQTSGGAGGTVYISGKTICGTGSVLAEGGGGNSPEMPRFNTTSSSGVKGCDRPGGGGRIALHYDAAAQAALGAVALKVSASYGRYWYDHPTIESIVRRFWPNENDLWRTGAGLGTVWVSDATLAQQLIANGLIGELHGLGAAYVHEGDLSVPDGSHVRFAGEGVSVKIGGDLTIGTHSCLEVGGLYSTNRSAFVDVYCGTTPVGLEVTGDLTVGQDGRLDIRSAATNGTDTCGAVVKVAGALTIASNGVVWAWSDVINGGSPKFEVASLDVQLGGRLTADWAGFGGSRGNMGFGPGAGGVTAFPDGVGGGHGGTGGQYSPSVARGGKSYDDAYRPALAGSGGGSRGLDYGCGGSGGGVVHVEATGAIVVDGSISANGSEVWSDSQYAGAGAGGTVFLLSKTFSGSGTLHAIGGRGHFVYVNAILGSGSGGGGRIAVWTGKEAWNSSLSPRRLVYSTTPEADEFLSFSGESSAAAGEMFLSQYDWGATYDPPTAKAGTPGTVWFCRVLPKKGLAIILK